MGVKEIRISEEVSAGVETCEHFAVPANVGGTGQITAKVSFFQGSAAFLQNAVVKIMWDRGGASEEILWSCKGEQVFERHIIIPSPDGVKMVSLCLDNGSAGDLVMSGYMEVSHSGA